MKTGKLYEFTRAINGHKWIARYEGVSGDCYLLSNYLENINVFIRTSRVNKCHISEIVEVKVN